VVDLARGADMMLCTCWDDHDRMIERGEVEHAARHDTAQSQES
jgi:hypothetical protein